MAVPKRITRGLFIEIVIKERPFLMPLSRKGTKKAKGLCESLWRSVFVALLDTMGSLLAEALLYGAGSVSIFARPGIESY
jgi:hypothetical protein